MKNAQSLYKSLQHPWLRIQSLNLTGTQRESLLFQSTKAALIRGEMSSLLGSRSGGAGLRVPRLPLDGSRSPRFFRRINGVVHRRCIPPALFFYKITSSAKHEMAFKGKAVDSKIVIFNLLLCVVIFYSLFYMIGSVCFGAFRLDHFDGLIPFDFKTEPAESNSKYLVNLLSLELTYFCSGLLFAAVVRRRVWDYALTVTLLHVMITSLVMMEFPMVWQWWLALGSGLFLMICNGQLIAYFTCQNDQSYVSFSIY